MVQSSSLGRSERLEVRRSTDPQDTVKTALSSFLTWLNRLSLR